VSSLQLSNYRKERLLINLILCYGQIIFRTPKRKCPIFYCELLIIKQQISSSYRMVNEWWIGRDVEGSGCGLFQGNISEFSFKIWGKPRRILIGIGGALAEVRTGAFKAAIRWIWGLILRTPPHVPVLPSAHSDYVLALIWDFEFHAHVVELEIRVFYIFVSGILNW
jgi:hypothetical protein